MTTDDLSPGPLANGATPQSEEEAADGGEDAPGGGVDGGVTSGADGRDASSTSSAGEGPAEKTPSAANSISSLLDSPGREGPNEADSPSRKTANRPRVGVQRAEPGSRQISASSSSADQRTVHRDQPGGRGAGGAPGGASGKPFVRPSLLHLSALLGLAPPTLDGRHRTDEERDGVCWVRKTETDRRGRRTESSWSK